VIALFLLALGPEGEGAHQAAAEHAPTWLGVPMWIWQSVNLLIFLGLLVYLLKKPLVGFLTGRKDAVNAAMKKAEEDRLRAEELTREVESRLARIETELAELSARAKRDAEAEHAELLTQAEADAARLVARAGVEMESRLRAARTELTSFAGDLAVELAGEILKKNVTPDDQKRLVKEGTEALTAPVKV